MKKTLLTILFLIAAIPSISMAAVRYVNPSCASACDGTTWEKGWAAVGDIVWGDLDDEESTLFLSGGTSGVTYADVMTVVHDVLTSDLYIRPGSASASPSGHAGLVTFATNVKLGNDAGGEAHRVVFSGETTIGSSTRNILFSLPGTVNSVAFINRYASNTDNKLFYVEITGAGDGETETAYVVSGFREVAYCYLHNNYGHSDIVAGASSATADTYGRISIHHNTILSGTTNYISGGSGHDIYNNVFDVSDAIFPYDIIHYFGTSGISYLRVWNNTFISEDQMIFLENSGGGASCTAAAPCKTEHIRIFNNTFSGVGGVGKPIMIENDQNTEANCAPLDDVYIVNNVFYGATYGIRFYAGSVSQTYSNFLVENNISYDAPLTYDGNNLTWADDITVKFDYNIIYESDLSYTYRWINAAHNAMANYTSVSTFATDHATFSQNITGNPSFISATDYNLNSGSPAINVGADLSALTNMPAGWPFDKAGTARPTGSAWEIGAYEYSTGGGTYPTIKLGTGAGFKLGTGAGFKIE